jgi:hypothetical protein
MIASDFLYIISAVAPEYLVLATNLTSTCLQPFHIVSPNLHTEIFKK